MGEMINVVRCFLNNHCAPSCHNPRPPLLYDICRSFLQIFPSCQIFSEVLLGRLHGLSSSSLSFHHYSVYETQSLNSDLILNLREKMLFKKPKKLLEKKTLNSFQHFIKVLVFLNDTNLI